LESTIHLTMKNIQEILDEIGKSKITRPCVVTFLSNKSNTRPVYVFDSLGNLIATYPSNTACRKIYGAMIDKRLRSGLQDPQGRYFSYYNVFKPKQKKTIKGRPVEPRPILVFKNGILVGEYENYRILCDSLGLDSSAIYKVIHRKNSHHKGYTFKWKNSLTS